MQYDDRGRLRPGQHVTGLPAGVDGVFLSLPIPGAHFAPGDAVPTISAPYRPRASGLLVPVSYTRSPVPLDSVATYLTGEDVWGVPVSADLTVAALRQLPLAVTLDFCAQLLRLVDHERLTQKQVDQALRAAFRPEVWRRISALLTGGNRVLIAPQVLLVLIKYAAVFSGDDLVPDVRPGNPLMAMFGVADDLQRRDDLEDDGDLVVGTGVPGRLEREIVATHHFHRQVDSQHVLAMFVRRWLQLPTELAGQRDVVDLASEFRAAVGIDLRDFVAVGMALYAYVLSHGPRVPRDHLRHLNIDSAVAERILGLVTGTVTDLRGWVHREQTAVSCWEFSHIERFPLLDRGDHLLVLRPGLLLQRFFGWLPSFDLEAGLGTGRPAERHKQRIRACMGRVSEAYARETLEVQARRHKWRVFGESQLQAALCRPGAGKSCDLTLDDGRRWALFEVTSSRLTRQSVASTSAEHLDQDIDKLVAKLAQIDTIIKNLRLREAALTGSPAAAEPRRYYPVLVLTEGFPVNPVTLTMLRQRAEEAQLLVGEDTSALEVVDVTELEMLEGADLGEITLLDALAAKSSAALARCNCGTSSCASGNCGPAHPHESAATRRWRSTSPCVPRRLPHRAAPRSRPAPEQRACRSVRREPATGPGSPGSRYRGSTDDRPDQRGRGLGEGRRGRIDHLAVLTRPPGAPSVSSVASWLRFA